MIPLKLNTFTQQFMTFFKKNNSFYWALLLLAAIAVFHSFFLNSDPDINADPSTRGAFTDEALYSLQSRNYILTGKFSVSDNDTWVQGPVYGSIQVAVYGIFGVKLSIARMITLVMALFVFFLMLKIKDSRMYLLFMIVFCFTEFHIFSFSHYALPYIITLSLVLLSLFLIASAVISEQRKTNIKFSILSGVAVFTAIAIKVIFFYALLIPLFGLGLGYFTGKENRKKVLGIMSVYAISITILMLIYFLCWYLPHKMFYDYVVFERVEVLIPGSFNEMLTNVEKNFTNLIWCTHLRYVFLIFCASISVAIFLWSKKKFSSHQKVLLVISVAWFLIELHRFAMWYLPFRYILGIIMSGFLFMSVVAICYWQNTNKLRYILIFPVFAVLYVNTKDIAASYNSRTTVISEVNNYFSSIRFENKKILGPWAACMNWESDAIILPVWDHYLNYKEPIKKYNPVAIVTEANEDDSNQAFIKQGIYLNGISDSVRTFKIGSFQLNVFWIRVD